MNEIMVTGLPWDKPVKSGLYKLWITQNKINQFTGKCTCEDNSHMMRVENR